MVNPSAAEQLFLELVNRDRADPSAAASRQGTGLNDGLNAGFNFGLDLSLTNKEITTAPKQPLVFSEALLRSAEDHSRDLITNNYFDHTSQNGSDPGDRMHAAGQKPIPGYDGLWGENIAGFAYFFPLTIDTSLIREMHNNLYDSSGHRFVYFLDDFSEIGIGVVSKEGDIFDTFYSYSAVGTQNFYDGGRIYITGVAIKDRDSDKFYDIGEGLGEVHVRVTGGAFSKSDTTYASGGYAIEVPGPGSYTIEFSGAGLTKTVTKSVVITTSNVKVDLFAGGRGRVQVITEHNDSVDGSNSDDTFFALGGADTVRGWYGDDSIHGGHGKDRLIGDDGEDTIIGGRADDRIDGGAHDDLLRGSGGRDTINGGNGNDSINGGEKPDDLQGGRGSDTINGGNRADSIIGDGGDDSLSGGDGNDLIKGGPGADTVSGGRGDDRIEGGGGDDVVRGDEGNDRITGDDGNDKLYGNSGDDSLFGGDGRDRLSGSDGDDLLAGQDDDDTLEGGKGDDLVEGGADNDVLFGRHGFDTLKGGSGDDALYGGHDDDTLSGGAGKDTLIGGTGDDSLDGGMGPDTYVLANRSGADTAQFDGSDVFDLTAFEFSDSGFAAILADARQAAGQATTLTLDFGNGDSLTIVTLGNVLTADDFLI